VTEIGQNGRLPPGEGWARAMAKVADLHARGSKRRYRVRGRLVEPGWWRYEAVKGPPRARGGSDARPDLPPLTRQVIAQMAVGLPRCAQRARSTHGGDSKVAWPSKGLAWRVANALGHTAYQCTLPAPAIGEHWHTTSSRKRRSP
jgi:hypothetical protein